MKKISYSILLTLTCFFCFALSAGATPPPEDIPITVEIDYDKANEMAKYLQEKGYGFIQGNYFSPELTAQLILDAGDRVPITGMSGYDPVVCDANNAYAVAVNSMEDALKEMLNSTRKSVLTKQYDKSKDIHYTSGPNKSRYGAVTCLRYKDKLYWCVSVVFANGPYATRRGKETKTITVGINPFNIDLKLNGWTKSSGKQSKQLVCGETAVPEINIPNLVPERAKGVEYTCSPDSLIYTSYSPNLFTVTPDGKVKALNAGRASLSVALKSNPTMVSKIIDFVIEPNPNAGGNDKPETETPGSTTGGTTGNTSGSTSGSASGSTSGNTSGSTTGNTAGNTSGNKTGSVTGTVTPAGKKPSFATVRATLPKASITSLKSAGSRKAKLKWKKCSGINGYQIQYSTNKKFKNNVKFKNAGKKKTSITFSKLKKKKTYYVRIRTYKKVSSGNVYGKWSKVKKIKIRK